MMRRSFLLVVAPLTIITACCTKTSYSQHEDTLSAKKLMAGAEAVDRYVKSGTVVGIGDGTTTYYAIKRLNDALLKGKVENVVVLPFTDSVRKSCISFNLPLAEWDWAGPTDKREDLLSSVPTVDLVICGADEIDSKFNMIKGANGTLARERIASTVAKKILVVCDDSKLSKSLGPGMPLPVEIYPANYEATMRALENIPSLKGNRAYLRTGTVR